MGFEPSSFFKGVEEHKVKPRNPDLPIGKHLVEIQQCSRFLSRDSKQVCIITVKVVESDNSEVTAGVLYDHGFFMNKHPYYFFRDLKSAVSSAVGCNPDDVSAEVLEGLFVDLSNNPSSVSGLANERLYIELTDAGEKFPKRRYYRAPQVAA